MSQLSALKTGRERQYRPPGPSLGGHMKALFWMASSSCQTPTCTQPNTCEEPRSHAPETACHAQDGSQSQLPHSPSPSPSQRLPEPSPASRSEPQRERYLNIEQVQLHRVSRVHVLIRVKELPSKQQRFVFIDSLFSECPAVIQPIHCNTATQIKELCLFFLLV